MVRRILQGLLVILVGLLLYVELSFSAVVESQGEGCSSDIKKAKREALKSAKLNAVERHLGVLINSKTLIVNSKIMRDIIQTRMVGTVKVIGEPDYGEPKIAGKDQICISVKVRLEIPDESLKPANYGLVLVLEKKNLRVGEEFSLDLSSEKPCYPYLFSVDAKGRVYRLLPNPIEGSPKLRGKLRFPTKKMISQSYKLVAVPLPDVPLPQREEVLFVCAKDKVKSFEEFFPSAFVEDEKELRKLLNTDYQKTVERFNEILVQIGAENYDMVDDFYIIRR